MAMACLSPRSVQRLSGVHPDLVKVVARAMELTEIDFIITEGVRTKARQKQLVASGASQTMNSRHLTGHAIDLAAMVGGKVRWDWPLYYKLADAMKRAAKDVDVSIEWGGDWESFKDGPHFQLPRSTYPA
jgi:peptidoglycan L-alanyl-D-glutamate endopeptidase CwlK